MSIGYCPFEDLPIKVFSLELKHEKSIAIVGSSGCRKSTIHKLVLRLIDPWSWEVLFDKQIRIKSPTPFTAPMSPWSIKSQLFFLITYAITANFDMYE
ncbi:MAG: ATP-binding cassette domain-containing protein [Eggerthellaceae bacterium]|nr:ATP-binding cassette domain-containing protein [Eggerthellaceae bacterium]